MIYTENVKKAINLMYEKHQNQMDKSGIPYVFHPFHVAEQMSDETTTIVALLHDVVEDTDTTFSEIESYEFGDDVVNALKLLTHDDSVDYFEYVQKLSSNPIARKVKLADLEHNMDLNRLKQVTAKDLTRVEKYKRCYDYLVDKENTNKKSL